MRATRNSRAPLNHAGLANLFHLLLDRFAQALQFDEQHGAGIHRVARVGGLFHHPQHHAVEHLDGHRRDGSRRDFADRAAGVFVRIVNGQQRLDHLGFAHQPDDDLGDQRHGAFRAGQQSGEVVAGQVRLFASGLDNGAVRHHQFETEHVIGRHAVGQGVGTAGVLGHVAANGAGALAGGVGRIEVAAGFDRQRDIQIDHARLHHRALVFEIDFENAVHAREGDHNAAAAGDGAARKARPGAAPHHRHLKFARDANDGGYFLGGARERHQVRRVLLGAAIVLVESEILRAVEITARPEKGGNAFLYA